MRRPRGVLLLQNRSCFRLAVPLAALACAVSLLSVPSSVRPASGASSLTLALFPGRRSKVLGQYRDYEIVYFPRRKGQLLPRLQLRKIPPRPVALGAITTSVDGPLDREFAGFPFTTKNAGSLHVRFPRLSGQLGLSMEDPAIGATVDGEEVPKSAALSYEQKVPGVGDVTVRTKASGEWGASFVREVEDLGRLAGSVNSQLDWNLDLDQSYPPMKGVTLSATYGATQDGMRARAKVERSLGKHLYGTYAVQNEAGQYTPAGFQHDAQLKLSSGKNGQGQSLEAQGTYNRKFSKVPVRGSLSYRAQLRPVTLEASVDFDRYKLRAQARQAQVTASVARQQEGSRPAELGLKVGKASATALLGGEKPRLRLAWG